MSSNSPIYSEVNILRPIQNGRFFQKISLNAFSGTKLFEFRLKFHWSFYHLVSIDYKPALVQIMACRLTGDRQISGTIMAYFTDAYMRHLISEKRRHCVISLQYSVCMITGSERYIWIHTSRFWKSFTESFRFGYIHMNRQHVATNSYVLGKHATR